jgi:L-fuconolactonase
VSTVTDPHQARTPQRDSRLSEPDRVQRWEQWLALNQEVAFDPDTPVVDPHHHMWDRGGHTYLPAQFAQDASGHRVLSTVYVECLWQHHSSGPDPLRPVGETEHVAVLARDWAQAGGPAIAAGIVARADLSLGDAVEAVLQAHLDVADGRLRGIRYATAFDTDPAIQMAYPTRAGMFCEPAVQAGARRLAQRGLLLDVWTYCHQLGDVLALARACPELTIVLDHVGGPIGIGAYARRRGAVMAAWRADMLALAGCENVVVKFGGLAMPLCGFEWRKLDRPATSDMLALAWLPYFEVCMESFGPGRCMFESNFPVDRLGCTYTSLWNAFKRLAAPLSVSERQALLATNAQRIYRI